MFQKMIAVLTLALFFNINAYADCSQTEGTFLKNVQAYGVTGNIVPNPYDDGSMPEVYELSFQLTGYPYTNPSDPLQQDILATMNEVKILIQSRTAGTYRITASEFYYLNGIVYFVRGMGPAKHLQGFGALDPVTQHLYVNPQYIFDPDVAYYAWTHTDSSCGTGWKAHLEVTVQEP